MSVLAQIAATLAVGEAVRIIIIIYYYYLLLILVLLLIITIYYLLLLYIIYYYYCLLLQQDLLYLDMYLLRLITPHCFSVHIVDV